MWAGMTGPDYVQEDGAALHRPSGLRLHQPPAMRFHDEPRIYRLDAASVVSLDIQLLPTLGRAREMQAPHDSTEDRHAFRRRHGALSRLHAAGGGAGLAWTSEVIVTLATLYFILTDTAGFQIGRAAYPDVLEILAPEIPQALRRRVVNPCA